MTLPFQPVSRRTTNTTNEEYVMTDFRLLIDGRLVKGAGTLDVINPATGRTQTAAPRADRAQLGFRGHLTKAEGFRACNTNSGRVAYARQEWTFIGSASTGRRKVCPHRTGSLSNMSDETERFSASSASRIGRRRILAGSSVAMPANCDANRLGAVLRTTTQVVLSEMLPISTGSLRFSRRRVTYPRPS